MGAICMLFVAWVEDAPACTKTGTIEILGFPVSMAQKDWLCKRVMDFVGVSSECCVFCFSLKRMVVLFSTVKRSENICSVVFPTMHVVAELALGRCWVLTHVFVEFALFVVRSVVVCSWESFDLSWHRFDELLNCQLSKL